MSVFLFRCQRRRLKFLITLTCAALAVVAGSAPLYAVCGSPSAIFAAAAVPPNFVSCGINGIGQYWAHQNAVWNRVGAGHDSGALNGNLTCVNCLSPGTSYRMVTDWGNAGADGCITGLPGDDTRLGTCDFTAQACTQATFATDCDTVAGDTVCSAGPGDHCIAGSPDVGSTELVVAGQTLAFLTAPILSRLAFGCVALNDCKQPFDPI